MSIAVTEKILVEQAKVNRALRESYIDLHGVPCVLRRIDVGEQRRDFYGDIRTEELTYQPSVGIRAVIAFSEYYNMKDTYDAISSDTRNETTYRDVKYTVRVKHDLEVIQGDLVLIPYAIPDSPNDTPLLIEGAPPDDHPAARMMRFRVVDVKQHKHTIAISKSLIMTFVY